MQCNSCGAILPAVAKHCPACGAPVFNPGPFQESVAVPPAPDLRADRMMPVDAYTPPVNNYGPPAYQQAPFYAGSQQPVYPQSALPVQQQPPARGGGLSRGMIILLIILALLIMSSGIGLIYYSTVYHPAQLHTQALATAQILQTREVQGTATASAHATGTAVAYANATATAQAQATATALQNIYTSATSGSPALTDALAGNSGSGWDEDLAQGGGGCGFAGGAYHASLYAKGFYFPCFAQNTNFSNFAYQVQMTITKGDEGGLIFRANNATTKFYVFRLGSDSIYDLFVSQDNKHITELSYGNSSAIHKYTGHSNLLTVVARRSNIYLYINKQYVGSVSDNTYKSGQIGLFAEDRTNPTDVAFSNVQVWKL